MKRRYGTLTGLALLCMTTFVATGAGAQNIKESMDVRFVASDLHTPGGIANLYRRIRSAAKRVCHEPAMEEMERYRAFQHCVDLAVENAVEQAHSPELTALHRRKAPHSAAG